jgi:hypothetical protein
MFGLPDKKKIDQAFRAFESRLTALVLEAKNTTPPGSDTLKLIERRIDSLERWVEDFKRAF